ncbi:type II toxin-antitoxin system RelE/ParE family toxin [Methylobacterium radiotolerans]|uniref:Addiction module toxin RelE n=1 Tax=Methylobacterium radiotolerans (strain ATCC 27329 / DSM 1819 / JCM 2831 / NBRC 15690 / NCIMB 10815 / 0-1) TaxID=426355 RepID=B1M9Z0_METRJ|nr:type II toxin-antitoxin system RelE/ParE family toxin [Methylobacterium radiotolerans]ACB28315.1 protein of unknown function DUF891 [Methylobacterium radiotolerans JCM 2831]GEN01291.1 hypothetical protein MRA01_58300 [Methylobacterium radiotolerans]
MPPSQLKPTPLPTARKQLRYVGSAQKDLLKFPSEVREEVAHALRVAQRGRKPLSAKPLTGDPAFKGASTLEIVEDHDTNTYRVIITVKYPEVVYVIDAFQKKSTSGISTPQKDIRRIKARLKTAAAEYAKEFKASGAK